MTLFSVVYAPERAQYCVERADGMRVYPSVMPFSDPDARKRASVLAATLNRMEDAPSAYTPKREVARVHAESCTPDIPPDFCYACDLAVYATVTPYSVRCPECGAQVAEGTAI